MGKALFLALKTLGDPSALQPQGDKKEGPFADAQGDVWGVILSEAKDLRGPSALRPQGDEKRGLRVTCGGHPERSEGSLRPFAGPSGYRPQGYGSGHER